MVNKVHWLLIYLQFKFISVDIFCSTALNVYFLNFSAKNFFNFSWISWDFYMLLVEFLILLGGKWLCVSWGHLGLSICKRILLCFSNWKHQLLNNFLASKTRCLFDSAYVWLGIEGESPHFLFNPWHMAKMSYFSKLVLGANQTNKQLLVPTLALAVLTRIKLP